MPLKHVTALLISAFAVAMVGCSARVSPKSVYGTYVVSYPFGTETLTLRQDGTFSQRVAIKSEEPVTVGGKWDFDGEDSRANLYGAMIVTDGSDRLKRDWRTPTRDIVSLDVEQHWFRVVMNSSATYPYMKQ